MLLWSHKLSSHDEDIEDDELHEADRDWKRIGKKVVSENEE